MSVLLDLDDPYGRIKDELVCRYPIKNNFLFLRLMACLVSDFKLTFLHFKQYHTLFHSHVFFIHIYFNKLQTTILKLFYQTPSKKLIWQPKIDRKQKLFSKLNLWSKLKTCKRLFSVYNFLKINKNMHLI